MELSRRRFLQASSGAVAASLAAGGFSSLTGFAADETAPLPLLGGPAHGQTRQGDMIYRPLGRTGEKVSLVGVGGAHLSMCSEDEAIRVVRGGLDRGINFLDNCWDYSDGKSEERMGKALRDGYRGKAFLMTKIDGRDKATAARQIDECLTRLGTDHVDLLQHHEILRLNDADRVFAPGGSMEAVLAARKAGKVRFIGFTGHKDPAMHLHMFEVADKHGFHFDTVQMPLNVMDAHFRSFARAVVPAATRRGTAVLAMKTMGFGYVLKSNTVSPVECLHYAMSLPVSVVITGMDKYEYLDQACEAVRTYQPLDQKQVAALLDRTSVAAAGGRYEPVQDQRVLRRHDQAPGVDGVRRTRQPGTRQRQTRCAPQTGGQGARMDVSVVTTDAEVPGGESVSPGTRVPVKSLFDHLEAGDAFEDLLRGFPSVPRAQAVAVWEEAGTQVLTGGR